MGDIDQRLAAIEARNARVESDKAWEVSWVRRGGVAFLTYVFAMLWLYTIGGPTPWLHATVPVLGYLVSTVSMRWLRERFIGK